MMKALVVLFFISTGAFASGYEKAILWGGKYSGLAGSAAAGVKGSDSIFYNPAGLVNSSLTGDVAFNLSSTTSQFKGPIVPNASVVMAPTSAPVFTYAGKQESSTSVSTIIPGITYSMAINDAWAFGVGYYAVGGARANYENIDFAPRAFTGKNGSQISITEFGAGVGYKASETLRFGLALRYTMTTAEFSSLGYKTSPASGAVTQIQNVEIKDIKAANLDSIRLGAQYDLSEFTKLGLVIRTETKISTTGKAAGKVNTCTNQTCAAVATLDIPETDAKVETSLPMSVGLGAEHMLNETWTLFGEAVYTQYSTVDKVGITGNLTVAGTTAAMPNIDQKWKDQTNIKLAADWHSFAWPVRFGYIWTSEVADKDYQRASFTPAGPAATYTLGTGHEFKMSNDSSLDFNIALDYTTVEGTTGTGGPQPLNSPAGKYEVAATAIHTGFAYRF